jgi:hypothetical protein
LEADRGLILRVRAHARGLIDYRVFNPRSSGDRLREKLILRELERSESLEAWKLLGEKAMQEAVVAASLRSGEMFAGRIERTDACYGSALQELLPWIFQGQDRPTAKLTEGEKDTLRREWERVFGSLDSDRVRQALGQIGEANGERADKPPSGANVVPIASPVKGPR